MRVRALMHIAVIRPMPSSLDIICLVFHVHNLTCHICQEEFSYDVGRLVLLWQLSTAKDVYLC